jgi:hypothetical protein
MLLEGLGKLKKKKLMASSGNEIATFRLTTLINVNDLGS